MAIQPEGEHLRKAVKWISEKRLENPDMTLTRLIEEACLTFDISPKDEDFLVRQLAEEPKATY